MGFGTKTFWKLKLDKSMRIQFKIDFNVDEKKTNSLKFFKPNAVGPETGLMIDILNTFK